MELSALSDYAIGLSRLPKGKKWSVQKAWAKDLSNHGIRFGTPLLVFSGIDEKSTEGEPVTDCRVPPLQKPGGIVIPEDIFMEMPKEIGGLCLKSSNKYIIVPMPVSHGSTKPRLVLNCSTPDDHVAFCDSGTPVYLDNLHILEETEPLSVDRLSSIFSDAIAGKTQLLFSAKKCNVAEVLKSVIQKIGKDYPHVAITSSNVLGTMSPNEGEQVTLCGLVGPLKEFFPVFSGKTTGLAAQLTMCYPGRTVAASDNRLARSVEITFALASSTTGLFVADGGKVGNFSLHDIRKLTSWFSDTASVWNQIGAGAPHKKQDKAEKAAKVMPAPKNKRSIYGYK